MRITIAVLVGTFFVVVAGFALPQDPVPLSPQMYTVLLENEHVRVLEFRCKPGDKEPMHSHPATVVYSLTASQFRSTTRDGETTEGGAKPGTAEWAGAVTHAWECFGPGEHRAILTELMGPAAPLWAQDRAADEAAIRAHAVAVERAINDRDAAALAALFTPDGDEINFDGPRLVGRDAIRQAQEARRAVEPPTMRFTLEVTGIRFLGPDTAIVETVARFSEGRMRSNRGTWVSVRQGGTWLIAALRVYPAERSQ